MTDALATISQEDAALFAEAATLGDLSKLPENKLPMYYGAVCRTLGFNPATQPFQYLKLNGKLVLYATRNAAEQLRKLHHVNVTSVDQTVDNDILIVTVKVTDRSGRMDMEIGAVPIKGLAGEALANARMKAITKAKRRATLSICGLGFLDESEVESIPGALKVYVDNTTGEIRDEPKQIEAGDEKLGAAKSKVWRLVSDNYGWKMAHLSAAAKHWFNTELQSFDLDGFEALYQKLVTMPPDAHKAIANGDDPAEVLKVLDSDVIEVESN